jgi:hypothetical protein
LPQRLDQVKTTGEPAKLVLTPDCKASSELCLVIIRGQKGNAGKITLTAVSEGLADGKAVIQTK